MKPALGGSQGTGGDGMEGARGPPPSSYTHFCACLIHSVKARLLKQANAVPGVLGTACEG